MSIKRFDLYNAVDMSEIFGNMNRFDTLVAIIARLRSPDGCPWDREQTHHSIKGNLEQAVSTGDVKVENVNLDDILISFVRES